MTERAKTLYLPLALGACSFLWNTFLIFYYLYPVELMKYPTAAEMYLKHALSAERVVDFSFLYFYLNVLLQILHIPVVSLSWINITIASASAALLYRLLLRFFEWPISLAGALAFLLNRNLIVYVQTFEPEILLLFFMLCFVFFLQRQTIRSATLAGFFLGMAVLIRPTFLPICLATPVYFFLISRDRNRWLFRSAAFLSLSLGCLSLIWIRNLTVLGYFSPYVMNPGTVFFEGSNPNSWGIGAVYPPIMNQVARQYSGEPDYHHEVYRMFASRIAGRKLSIPEANAYWSDKGINFLRDYPARTARMILTKILHLFHDYQWNDLSSTFWNDKRLKDSALPLISFAVLSAMSLTGMLLLRKQWRNFLLFYLLFFFHFAFSLFFYITARQRVSIIFVFVFFACATLRFILYDRKRALALVAVIALSLPLYFQTDLMKEESHLWQALQNSQRFLNQAYRYRTGRKLAEASQMSAFSLAAAPWLIDSRRPSNLSFEPDGFAATALRVKSGDDFSMRFDRAVLNLEAGRPSEALAEMMELAQHDYHFNRGDQQSSEPYFYLAKGAWMAHDNASTLQMLRIAERRSPGDPSTLAFLSAITNNPEYDKKLYRYFDEIDAHFFLGEALLNTSQPQRAIPHFSYVVEKLPEYRRGFVYLAAALGGAGQWKQGVATYRTAIGKSPDPVLLENEILSLFKLAALKEPQNLFSQFSYGVVLRQFGHFQQALEMQKKNLTRDPQNPQIQSEIQSLEKIISD